MLVEELLQTLDRRGVTVTPDGTHIRLWPSSALTPELREELRTRKADVLLAIGRPGQLIPHPWLGQDVLADTVHGRLQIVLLDQARRPRAGIGQGNVVYMRNLEDVRLPDAPGYPVEGRGPHATKHPGDASV